jgi:hypothetical protein
MEPHVPPRHRRRLLAAIALTVTALVVAVLAVGLGVRHRVEHRVADSVDCALPEGAEVSDVDLDGDSATVTVSADEDVLQAVVDERPGPGPAPRMRIADGVLRADLDAGPASAAVELATSVEDGEVRLTPERVRVGSRTFDPGLLRRTPASAGFGRQLVVPLDLPAGEVASVDVVDDRLVLDLELPLDPDAAPPCP